ncbi:MAG: hypothetical protein NZ480_09395, partial [Bdellovibrionaceae bacterium]|nr:hypothetical protein [Pseudobdellovibrionaceae bacterium]
LYPTSKGFQEIIWDGPAQPRLVHILPLEVSYGDHLTDFKVTCTQLSELPTVLLERCDIQKSSKCSESSNTCQTSWLIKYEFSLDWQRENHSEFYVSTAIEFDDKVVHYKVPFRILRKASLETRPANSHVFDLPTLNDQPDLIPFTPVTKLSSKPIHNFRDFMVTESRLGKTQFYLFSQESNTNTYRSIPLTFFNEDRVSLAKLTPHHTLVFLVNRNKNSQKLEKIYFVSFLPQSRIATQTNNNSESEEHPRFYIFDHQGKLLQKWSLSHPELGFPRDQAEINWYLDENGLPKPIWVQNGPDLKPPQPTLRELWRGKKPKDGRIPRIYYYDAKPILNSVQAPSDFEWFDMLPQGIIPTEQPHVLVFAQRKSHDPELWIPRWPGEICLFAVFVTTHVISAKKCFGPLSLPSLGQLTRGPLIGKPGMYWVGSSFPRGSLFVYVFDFENLAFHQYELKTPYHPTDAILALNGGFAHSHQQHSFFTFSNSLIQYHEPPNHVTPREINLNRFSFFSSLAVVGIHFPLSINRRPSLLAPASPLLRHYIRIIQAPNHSKHLHLPISLQIVPAPGCSAIDSPFEYSLDGITNNTFLDLICGKRLIRWPLHDEL